ncbi:sensor histidine kinase [Phormidium sp. CCY1219]|uniref:sensor histidine kinase n=1 Tax=Phormidium sp. CCY1219 TaxID=2886104 RepID=UPI002D1F05B0|nr:HAMP domain-containing sensor histidine kinase [Phormidium sp. CCY1219]MEB3830965.1 HAMP domain-containing histidine kinase [Phormidium sp. CCY1219]
MYNWLLPTISEVLTQCSPQNSRCQSQANRDNEVGQDAGNDKRHRREIWHKQVRADRHWYGAIAALNELLVGEINGLVVCGPVPMLSQPGLLENFSTWTLSAPQQRGGWLPSQLLPTSGECSATSAPTVLPLMSGDPLAEEQFCLVLTSGFSLAMVNGSDASGEPAFQFSFDPQAIHLVWQALRSRVLPLKDKGAIAALDRDFEQFAPREPHYQTVCDFTRQLLDRLPEPWHLEDPLVDAPKFHQPATTEVSSIIHPLPQHANPRAWSAGAMDILVTTENETSVATIRPHLKCNENRGDVIEIPGKDAGQNRQTETASTSSVHGTRTPLNERLDELRSSNQKGVRNQSPALDVELLQAIAHEVRTPLATIRTLTKLLLKRRNLDADVIKRLEAIDRECSEQIDRFGLIFRAVELETASDAKKPVHLTSTSLTQVFNSCIPRWQKQATRRNLTLDAIVPPKMPPVVSDPSLLDRVLTGAIENFTSTLPAGSNVRVEVVLAGHQLKVELHSKQPGVFTPAQTTSTQQTLKSIGQMLMFQPETGNLSLNLSVTKNLFQAIGGKLIVRNRPQQGQVLTIFLPLELRGETSKSG